MPITLLHIPALNESVAFSQSRRARRLSITVRPFKGIRVAYPTTQTIQQAQNYLYKNLDWARKHIASMKVVEQEHQSTINQNHIDDLTNAKSILKTRLHELAQQYKFSYNRVFIRNQRTLWGSCSHNNNINLNINLVRLRPELMDYLLLHELVHTKIKNHSKKYWKELDKYCGGRAKILRKELKKHRLGVCW